LRVSSVDPVFKVESVERQYGIRCTDKMVVPKAWHGMSKTPNPPMLILPEAYLCPKLLPG
jgi:hypothetical protein